jgi:hypothetical protein
MSKMVQSSETLKESCAKARKICRRKESPVALNNSVSALLFAGTGNSIREAALFMGAQDNSGREFIKII